MIAQSGSCKSPRLLLLGYLARIIHHSRGALFNIELFRLVHPTTLALFLSLAGCDQYPSIAVVDATFDADNPSLESPDRSFDDGADAAGKPSANADAAGIPSNPPTAGNDGVSNNADCVERPIVTGCDPTKEGTCDGMMQCVVDQAASIPTGVCVFSTPIDIICFGSFATESCPPTFICWGGACREMCLCDEDCSTGRCCGEAVGSGGFKLCADC